MKQQAVRHLGPRQADPSLEYCVVFSVMNQSMGRFTFVLPKGGNGKSKKRSMTKTVLSMGGGVNSTALLLSYTGEIDYVLFADTGSEKPGTYKYLQEWIEPYCLKRQIPFITVKRTGKSKYAVWPLHEYYEKKARTPFRQGRETTVMWKIRPIYKWLKENANPARVLIAIDAGEIHRMRDSGVDWVKNEYPLIDQAIDRSHCREIIRKAGWPEPEKSGCWCCPFNSLAEWQNLKLRYPELYKRALALEQAARDKWNADKSHFHPSGPLIQLDTRFNNTNLDNYETQECTGTCFT